MIEARQKFDVATWALLVCLASCAFHEEKQKPAPPDTRAPLTFTVLTQQIIKPKCLRCHTGDGSRSGFDLTDYKKLMDSGDIFPKDPEASPLYKLVKENRMPPPPSPPLSEAEKGLLYRWIAEGAKP